MSFKARDIAGQRFGLWLAKEHVGGSKWLCRCDCGCELAIKLHKLVRGGTMTDFLLFSGIAFVGTFLIVSLATAVM